jgi:hypothetical protein
MPLHQSEQQGDAGSSLIPCHQRPPVLLKPSIVSQQVLDYRNSSRFVLLCRPRKTTHTRQNRIERLATSCGKSLSDRRGRSNDAITLSVNGECKNEIGSAAKLLTAHRREIAEVLAEKHDRGDTENMSEAFIKIQDVIEAIERAVWHERYIAGQKSEPFSPFGFGSAPWRGQAHRGERGEVAEAIAGLASE